MKNVIKVFLILALVFLGVGITFIAMAFAGGVTKASLQLFGNDQNKYNTYEWSDDLEGVQYENGVYRINGTDIHSAELEVNSLTFEIYTSEDNNVYVETNGNDVDVEYWKGELSIEAHDSDWDLFEPNQPPVVVYLPAGHVFTDVSFDVDSGDLRVNTPLEARYIGVDVESGDADLDSQMDVEMLTFEVGSGDIHSETSVLVSKQTKLTVGSGDISVESLDSSGILEVECGSGSVQVEGKIYGDLNASVSSGNIGLEFNAMGETYLCHTQVGSGNIKVSGNAITNDNPQAQENANEQFPTATLKCGSGGIRVNFQ